MKRRILRVAIAIALSVLLVAGGFEILARTALRSPAMFPENLQPAAGRDFAAARMLESWREFGLSYRGRPGAQVKVYGVEYRHDELGLRGPRRATDRDPEVLRVLVLGDSNAYGWRVAEDATFSAVAERVANAPRDGVPARRVEFWNAGLPGYNTRDAYRRYLSLRDSLRPDVVLLAWFVNDCERFGFDVTADGFLYFDPLPIPVALKPIGWNSYAYRWLTLRATERMRRRGELDLADPAAFAFSADQVAKLAAEVTASGARFALLDVPLLEPAPGEQRMSAASYRERAKSDRLAALAAARGFPYLELLPAIEGMPVALTWASIEHDDHHPSPRAHEAFGNRIAEFLRSLHWLD